MEQEQMSAKTKEQLMPAQLLVLDQIGIGFGAISTAELTQAQAEHGAQEVESFRVKLPTDAIAICFDGRFGQFLGPKLAGAFKSLQVGAKAIGYDVEGSELYKRAVERGFIMGAHVDSTNQENGFLSGTGCGANDKEATIVENYHANLEVLLPTAEALINVNATFNRDQYTGLRLAPTTKDLNELRGIVGAQRVETLLNDGRGVSGHDEWVVFFNYEDGTTIDRDAYYKATGKKVFAVDMWYIKKLADGMAEGVDAQSQASDMYHAMVAYQLATYITLCDGSHRAVIATKQTALAA